MSVAAAVLLSGVFFLLSERGPTEVFRSPARLRRTAGALGAVGAQAEPAVSREPSTP
jgi:hypothetical protein